MATTTIGELILHMEVDGDKKVMSVLQRFAKQVNNAGKSTRSFGNSVRNTNSSMGNFNVSLGSMLKLFGAYKVIDLAGDALSYFVNLLKDGVKTGLEYNTNIEYLNAAIRALTGSEEVAVDLTKQMVDLAAETPFQISHYSKAAKTLLGYGVEVEDIIPTIKMLGEVSVGNATAFDRLALAYGQTTAKGKLQAEEVRQMVNQGFNPLQWIVEETGIKLSDLSEKMKAGEISTEMVTRAFQLATSEGSRFNGIMEELSNTYKGQSEKIKEYGEIFWGKVTKPLYDFLASDVLPFILENIKKLTEGVDILYGAIGKVIPKLEDFFNAFRTGDIEDLYNALKNLIPSDYEDKLVTATIITLKVRDALKWLKDKATIAFEYLKENGKKAFDFWESQVQEKVLPVIEDLIDKVSKLDFTDAKESLDKLKESFIMAEPYLKMFARFSIREVIDASKNMWTVISQMATNIPTELKLMIDLASMILDGFTISAAIFKGDTESMEKATEHLKTTFISYFGEMRRFTLESLATMGAGLLVTVRDMNRNTNTYVGRMTANFIDKMLYTASNLEDIWNIIRWTALITLDGMIKDTKRRLNSIKQFFIDAWDAIKRYTIHAFNENKTMITSIMLSIYKVVNDRIQDIKRVFKSMKTAIKKILQFSLYNSGRNLIGTLISGIWSRISDLRSAVSYGASIVKSYLGFGSPTKEGPGKTADKWIPNLMEMMIASFNSYRNRLAYAANNTGSIIASGITRVPTSSFDSRFGLNNSGLSTSTSNSNAFNIVINADSFTNGRSIGRELVSELNKLGVLTHK